MSKSGAMPGLALPILAAAAGIAFYSVMDAAMKRASLEAGLYMALLLRAGFSTLIMAPIWLLSGGRRPASGALRMHMLRGLVSTGSATTFFWGLERTPLAEAIAISFISPLIALCLAAMMLGERIRWPAVVAALLGLAGVGVIGLARIGEGVETAAGHGAGTGWGAGWGIAAILVSAALYAWNLILQRQQAQISGPVEVALFQSLTTAVIFALLAPWLAGVPPLVAVGWAALAGMLLAMALATVSWAWGRAEAQVLLPVEYTAFIWAAIAGWLMFGERLGWATIGGLALILVGCRIGIRPSSPVMHNEQTGV